MKLETLADGIFRIALGFVNAYLIEDGGELTLVDTGTPGNADRIVQATERLGRSPGDIRRIILTHLHYDHVGSVPELGARTGASIWMHPADAEMLAQGKMMRPFQPAPRLWARLGAMGFGLARSLGAMPEKIEPISVDREIEDGDVLDEAAQARVIHVPGHAAGQLALLLPREGGVLLAADAMTNFIGLDYPPILEDLTEGRRSIRRLARERVPDSDAPPAVTCFGHERPFRGDLPGRIEERFGPFEG
jgi:glyoxylase-like metal-dependent hydrolase (beta-lactamase superfamily II)